MPSPCRAPFAGPLGPDLAGRAAAVPGWAWMVLCALLFATMGLLTKVLIVEHAVPVFWVGWIRFLLGLLAVLVPGLGGAWPLRVHSRRLWVVRGVLGSSGVFLMVLAIAHIGLGRAMVLVYLMGLFGALSGIFILREIPGRPVFAALVLATVGVLLCGRAGWPRGAEWAPLGAALLSGITLSLVRRLRRTDSVPVVLLSQGLFGSLLLAAPALTCAPPRTAAAWLLLLAMSLADVVGQLCMTQGLSMLPVARGAALMMLTPVFSLLAGVLFLAESLRPPQWLGVVLVLGASALATARAPSPAPTAR